FGQMPVDVLSIDWKLPLDEARRRANGKALQGNVDPGVLLGTPEGVREAVFAARRAAGPTGRPGPSCTGTGPGNRRAGANLARVSAIPIRLRGETLSMTTELLDKYNVQGPRYTSYPTASEWTDSSPADYEAACARANAKGSSV